MNNPTSRERPVENNFIDQKQKNTKGTDQPVRKMEDN